MACEFRLAQKVVDFEHPVKGKQTRTLYGIVEVYYGEDNKLECWTNFIDPNGWEDVDDLRLTIENMLSAFGKPMFEEDIYDEDFKENG